MILKRRRALLLEIAQGNEADAELRKLASIGQRNAAQAPSLWLSETSDRDSCRRSSARSVRQEAGAAFHAFILTCACRCLLRTRLGNAAPAGHLNYAPNLLNTLGMRPSNSPRNVASFKNAESVAIAPQLRAAAKLTTT